MKNFLKQLIERLKFGPRRGGLIDLRDDKNFGSRALFKPTKEDVAAATKETFVVFWPKKLDQFDSDHCVGFGGAYEADATETFAGPSDQGSGSFIFACAKKWSGRPISEFGTSLLAGCMARLQYGVCRKELWDYVKGRRDYYSNFNNIPKEAFEDAKKHKAGSVWEVNIPWGMTTFDAIVSTLWHFRDKKVLIGTGNNAHRITVIGYDKPGDALICLDTYGERTYSAGVRHIGRVEARTLFTPYFVIDIDRSLAEILVEYNDKVVKTVTSPDCFLIQGGKKHLILDEKAAWSHGYLLAPYDGAKLTEIIEQADLDKISLGENVRFEGGKNEWIIRRIAEKYNIKL